MFAAHSSLEPRKQPYSPVQSASQAPGQASSALSPSADSVRQRVAGLPATQEQSLSRPLETCHESSFIQKSLLSSVVATTTVVSTEHLPHVTKHASAARMPS